LAEKLVKMDKREEKNTEKNLYACSLQFVSIILVLVIDKKVTLYTLTERRPLFSSLPFLCRLSHYLADYPSEVLLNTT